MNGLAQFIIGVILYVFNVFAIKTLYNWFAVPYLGVQELQWAMAFGLTVLVGLLFAQHIPRDERENIEMVAFSIITPITALVIGFIAQANL